MELMLWWEDLHILDFLGGPNFLMFYPFVKPCAWKYAVVWKHAIKTTETKGIILSLTHKNTDLKFEERKCKEFWDVLRRWKYKTKQTPPFFLVFVYSVTSVLLDETQKIMDYLHLLNSPF